MAASWPGLQDVLLLGKDLLPLGEDVLPLGEDVLPLGKDELRCTETDGSDSETALCVPKVRGPVGTCRGISPKGTGKEIFYNSRGRLAFVASLYRAPSRILLVNNVPDCDDCYPPLAFS